MIAVVVLSVLTFAWIGLALLPALMELARPKDDEALAVDMYEADVRSFATGFRRYMAAQLPNLQVARRLRGGHAGVLPDGTPLLKLVEQASPLVMHGEGLDEDEATDRITHKLVVSYARMVLPRGLASVGGLYATEFVCGGEAGVFRALLGERDVVLGRNSVVLRWIHSDANLSVEEGSVLHGRASAERRLTLAPNTRFERLYGRPIMFGVPYDGATPAAQEGTTVEVEPDRVLDASPSRVVVDGDLVIPPNSLVRNNLVVRGAVTVGSGCRVEGSIKSHGHLTIGAFSTVTAGVVSTEDIAIGEAVIVAGPVIAEGDVELGAGALIGEYSAPATITATSVFVQPGATVFGTIWTRECGYVEAVAAPAATA